MTWLLTITTSYWLLLKRILCRIRQRWISMCFSVILSLSTNSTLMFRNAVSALKNEPYLNLWNFSHESYYNYLKQLLRSAKYRYFYHQNESSNHKEHTTWTPLAITIVLTYQNFCFVNFLWSKPFIKKIFFLPSKFNISLIFIFLVRPKFLSIRFWY